MLDMSLYTFYVSNNKVIAVSTYAGKPVRGMAKCNPTDQFELEKGKLLAAARCNAKVAQKRLARANKKCNEAFNNYDKALIEYYNMSHYKADSEAGVDKANEILNTILNTL